MHLLILMILMSFGTCKVVPKKADPIDESFEMLPYPYHPWDWYTYLHEWLIFMVNLGKYTIHGCYGICSLMGPKSLLWAHFFKPSYYRYGPEYVGKNSVTTPELWSERFALRICHGLFTRSWQQNQTRWLEYKTCSQSPFSWLNALAVFVLLWGSASKVSQPPERPCLSVSIGTTN